MNQQVKMPQATGNLHNDTQLEQYIKIAADSIDALRKVDVFRVLGAVRADNIDGVKRGELASFIARKRPELRDEVEDVMREEFPNDACLRINVRQDPDGAKLFFEELLASVETLGGVAEQHGINTLTDLMYLQQAIFKGETIEVWPGETEVGKVVQVLPSADRWLEYTVLGGDWKNACERSNSPRPRQ